MLRGCKGPLNLDFYPAMFLSALQNQEYWFTCNLQHQGEEGLSCLLDGSLYLGKWGFASGIICFGSGGSLNSRNCCVASWQERFWRLDTIAINLRHHGCCLFQGLNVNRLHSPTFSHDTLQHRVGCKPPLWEVRDQVVEVVTACNGILLLNKC